MYNPGEEYSAVSAADLSEKKGYLCKTDSSGNIVLAAAATDAILGVIADGGRQSGDTVSVMLINGTGTYKVVSGASFSKDAYLTTDGSGKAIGTTSSGNRVFGRAVRAATGADQVVEYVKYNEKY
jgi:hypothetical protein